VKLLNFAYFLYMLKFIAEFRLTVDLNEKKLYCNNWKKIWRFFSFSTNLTILIHFRIIFRLFNFFMHRIKIKSTYSSEQIYIIFHITCLAHGIRRVTNNILSYHPKVDKLIAKVKQIYLKSLSRIYCLKQKFQVFVYFLSL